MANNLFNVRLHDRLGETQYTDVLTGERKVTSLWLRNVAGHSTVKSGDGQLKRDKPLCGTTGRGYRTVV